MACLYKYLQIRSFRFISIWRYLSVISVLIAPFLVIQLFSRVPTYFSNYICIDDLYSMCSNIERLNNFLLFRYRYENDVFTRMYIHCTRSTGILNESKSFQASGWRNRLVDMWNWQWEPLASRRGRYISHGSTMCKRYRPRTPRSSDPSSFSVTLLEFLLFGRYTAKIYVIGRSCEYTCVYTCTRCTRTDTRNAAGRIVNVWLPKLSELLRRTAILEWHL